MIKEAIIPYFLFSFERKLLLGEIIRSKILVSDRDLVFGYLWWVLDPVFLMIIYWFLINIIFGRGGENYPIFILCGLFPFRAFAMSFSQSIKSLVGKFGLISQINFPRIFLPISDVIVNHIKLIAGLIIIHCFMLFFPVTYNFHIYLILIPFILQILIVTGLSMIVSIVGVFFRDLARLSQFIIRILIYLSPILYSIDKVPEKYQMIFYFNPLTPIIIMYRNIILYNGVPELKYISIASLHATVFLLLGFVLFITQEKKILKYI